MTVTFLSNTPAYLAALSQLAAALAEFDPTSVYEMLEEDGAVDLLHDLSATMAEEQPALYAALKTLNAA